MTAPTLAFAHANGVPGGSYQRFLAPLEAHWRVQAMPAIGLDPRYPVDKHWHSLAREVEAWLETLERPVSAVGHSMGAVLLFMVAVRRPDWFRSLVMLDPPLVNGPARPLFNLLRRLGMADRVTPAGKSKGRRAHWPDTESVRRHFIGRGMFAHFDPRCLDDYLKSALVHSGDGFRLLIPPETEVDIFRYTPGNLHRLPKLLVPGAVVSGATSPKPFVANHRRHCRRHRMTWAQAPGGHMFPLEQPVHTATLVQALLEQLEHSPMDMSQGAPGHGC